MVNAVDHTTSAVPADAEARRPLPKDRRRGALTRPARQSSLREHNLSLALRYIVDSPVPTTRARVADGTGLTKATVSELVDLLVSARLVTELEPEAGERVGRPGVPLIPAARTFVGLGLEVQVDHIAVRAVDLQGTTLYERVVHGDYRRSDPDLTLRQLAKLVEPVVATARAQGGRVAGACVSVPGLARLGSGVVRYAPNLGWEDVDVTHVLGSSSALRDVPIEVGNDADLGALAEARTRSRLAGLSRLDQNFLFIAGEVGIGGAIVLGGELASGMHGWSGEIGHAVVDPNGPRCNCGALGCLEQFAGKDALARAAGVSLEASTETLRGMALKGDLQAIAAITTAATALGRTASSAMSLIDVDRLILGGAYAVLCDLLRPGIEAELTSRVISRRWLPLHGEGAVSGEMASLTGAALRVIDHIVADPNEWVGAGS